ncbi:hypothetical protein HF295_00485 [Hujiaoplasma nucleasis]|uniref:Uncharacterized protein n=1 Tax=Hujiaoplasma nucleasis TaxID=2725268 RepID=A0A7L6N4H7_9MOLU|nr:hypothetical protein [Hujiaoplasma nucleasis]QLY39414.1 hypothetical protein HF295_00485 [Hujiaoplasma nucleasis]
MTSRRYKLALFLIVAFFITRQAFMINDLNIITRMNYSIDLLYILLAALMIIIATIVFYVLPSRIYIEYSFRINFTSLNLRKLVANNRIKYITKKFKSIKIYKEYQVFRC